MIRKLYELKDSTGYISPSDVQEINRYLSKITINDLPFDQLKNVEDYLLVVLNSGSVSFEYRGNLDGLLKDIEKNRNIALWIKSNIKDCQLY